MSEEKVDSLTQQQYNKVCYLLFLITKNLGGPKKTVDLFIPNDGEIDPNFEVVYDTEVTEDGVRITIRGVEGLDAIVEDRARRLLEEKGGDKVEVSQ